MALLSQHDTGTKRGEESLLTSYVPGKVGRKQLPCFDDLHILVDAQGDLHTIGRIITDPLNQQTFGDQGAIVQKALVELEEFAIKNGYLFKWHRVTTLEAAHRAKNSQYDVANIDQIAYVISAVWVKADKNKNGEFGASPTPVEQVIHQISGYESIIEDFKHEAQILAKPFMSTKGVGIGNLPILAPAFRPGLSGHHTSCTSWDMVAEMLLTTEASFYDKYPEIRPFSRQSLKSGTLVGTGDRAESEVKEFSLSLPLHVQDMQALLRDPRRMQELLRRNGIELPPLEERLVPVRSLRGPHAAFIEKQQKRFEIPNYGGCHPQSGRGIVRMVVLGEPFGEFGSGNGGITQLELVERACQMILNLLEKTAADEMLSPEEKRNHPEPQRKYGTFTFNFQKSSINYAGMDPQESLEITNILITCPFEEQSLAARKEPVRYADGTIVPTWIDPETGIIYFHERRSYQALYAKRDAFNGSANKGVWGLKPFGAKCPAHEAPIDVDISWEDREVGVILRYLNTMTPEFIPWSYANDNPQANIQALGADIEGLARSLIFHIGAFVDWEHFQRTGERRPVPPMQAVKGWVDKHIHSKDVYEQGPFQPSSRGTGFNNEYFEIFRDPVSHQYQWYDRHSPFGDLIESVQTDVKRNAKVLWIDPTLTNGQKKSGYAIFEQFAGLDLEIPMHGYVLYFLAYIANCLDQINSELPEGQYFRAHQTDLVRQWDEFYRFIRNLKGMKEQFEKEISEVIFERVNQGASLYGAPPLTSPLSLKLSVTGEDLVELFSRGEKSQEILDRLSKEAIAYYRNDLEYYNLRRSQQIYPDEMFGGLDIAPLLIEKRIDELQKGGAREYGITDTNHTDITFRFMLILRGTVESGLFTDYEEVDENAHPTKSVDQMQVDKPWERFENLSTPERAREIFLSEIMVGDDDSVLKDLLGQLVAERAQSLDYEMATAWQEYAVDTLLYTSDADFQRRHQQLLTGIDAYASLSGMSEVRDRIHRHFLNVDLSDEARARAEQYLMEEELSPEQKADLLKMSYPLLLNPKQLSHEQYQTREILHQRLYDLIENPSRPKRSDQRFDKLFGLLEQKSLLPNADPQPALKELSDIIYLDLDDYCGRITELHQRHRYTRFGRTANDRRIDDRLKLLLTEEIDTFFGL